MQIRFLHRIVVLLAECSEVKCFRLVDLFEFAPEQHLGGVGEKAADGHYPPTSQQQVLTGGEIEASHALSVLLPDDDERTLCFEEMGQDDFEHLFVLREGDGELMGFVAILEEVENGEVKEQMNHGLNGLVLILLALSQDVRGDVGHSPVLEAPCDVMQQQFLI